MIQILREFIQESLNDGLDHSRAENWVKFIRDLLPDEPRPITFKRKQPKGDRCCWCGLTGQLVGVEHIIPRGAGGPVVEPWNLAWACYPCNKKRGSDIGPLQYEWMKKYVSDLGKITPPDGWLYLEMLSAPAIPTKQELLAYFKFIR